MDEKIYVISKHDIDDIFTYICDKPWRRTVSIKRATHYTLEEAQKELLRLTSKYGEKYYITTDK